MQGRLDQHIADSVAQRGWRLKFVLLATVWVLVIVVIGPWFSLAASAGELAAGPALSAAEEEALLEEYKANLNRLQQFYGNLRMRAIHRWIPSSHKDAKRMAPMRVRVPRARDNEYFRLDHQGLTLEEEEPRGMMIELLRPEGYLKAHRKYPNNDFVLIETKADREEGKALLAMTLFQWAPFYAHVIPLERLVLRTPPFAKSCRRTFELHSEGAERLVTLTLDIVSNEKDYPIRIRFVFYRDRAWALKEFSWGAPQLKEPLHRVRQGWLEYEGSSDGIPLLKRVTFRMEHGPTREYYGEDQYEVEEIKVGAVPLEEFTPDAFGIHLGKQRSRWGWAAPALVSGVLLVTVYVVLLRRRA